MDQNERDTLGKSLTMIAFLYGYEFPKERASMFISALIEFIPASLDEYLGALKKYTEDSKNRTFPNPSQLRIYLRPELSVDAKANESANKIRQAITKFGWPEPKQAREFMGELAWAIVERFGGWQYICENHGVELNPLMFHAQARDSAKSILEQGNLGIVGKPIGISELLNQGLQKIGWKNE
jgi:hypothetical protein